MSPPTVDTLVDSLRRLDLLTPAHLEKILQKTGRYANSQALGVELTRRGWLTPFQVEMLLADRAKELFIGHYRLLAPLGGGAHGQVYRARHERMNRLAALKLMRPELLADADALAQFYQEVGVVGRLSHPHLVHAFDAGPAGDTHFLASEYVPGHDLARVVADKGRLQPHVARTYILQAAAGLAHAQRHGLVHLGLKPTKLLLSEDAKKKGASPGIVKVLDVGMTHSVGVAAEYRAPEQRAGQPGDTRSDVYSLGAIYYLLLTGRAPAPAPYGSSPAFPKADKGSSLPREVTAVLERMLAEAPADRYQSPLEVVQALGGTEADSRPPVGGESSVTLTLDNELTDDSLPTDELAQRFAARDRSRRWLLLGAGGLALLVGGLLIALLSNTGAAPEETEGPPPPEETIAAPESQLSALIARKDSGENPTTLWRDLLEYRTTHAGTADGLKAAYWLSKIPSPLDKLPEPKLGPDEWLAEVPTRPEVVARLRRELAAVLGDPRLRSGYPHGTAAALSPSGKLLALTYGDDPIVHVWDAATGKRVQRLRIAQGTMGALAFSPDNRLLAVGTSGGGHQAAQLWDTSTGQKVADLKHAGTVFGLAFGPDPEKLVSASTDGVRVWSITAKAVVQTKHFPNLHQINALAVSRDGRQIAAANSDGIISLVDAAGNALHPVIVHPRGVKALAFSPDGKMLASGGSEGFVRLWRLDRPEYSRLPGSGTVRGLAFTPDGKSLISAAEDGRTIVWNLETEKGRELPRAGTVAGLTGLTLDAAGKLLAVCGVGTGPGLWDLETRTLLLRPTVGHHVEVQSVAFSADGATLMSAAEDRTLRLWDLAVGKERKILEGRDPLESVTVSADGKFLAASGKDGFLSFWDVDHDYARSAVHTKNPRSAVAFSPTAALVASALTNGNVELWRPDHFDKPLRTLVAHPDKSSGVMTLAFSPDGKWLATASRGDLQAKVWDVQTGKKLASLPHTLPPSDLVFRADGQALLTADGEGLIRFWQTADWHEGPAFPLGDGPPPNKPPNWGLRLDGSPDGRYLAVASPSRGSIRILDLTTSSAHEARSWQLSGRVRDLAFAPDSRHLAVAGSNGLVYVLRCRFLGE